MTEDLTGDWLNEEYKAKHEDFAVILKNLHYMLYRYKNDEQIKTRTNALIAKVDADYKSFLLDNSLKIKERDMLFLGGFEETNESDQ